MSRRFFQNTSKEIDKKAGLKKYGYVLRRHFLFLSIFFLLAVLAAVGYALKVPNQYRASAQLIVGAPEDTGSAEPAAEYDFLEDPVVLRQVAAQSRVQELLGTDSDVAGRLGRMVSLRRLGESRIFEIRAESTDPQVAALLANSFARAVIRRSFEQSLYYSKELLAWLPERGREPAEITIEDPFGSLRQISRQELIERMPSVQADPTIHELLKKKRRLKKDTVELLRTLGEGHVAVRKARASLRLLEEDLNREEDRLIRILESKASGQGVRHARILEEARIPRVPCGPNRPLIVLLGAGIALFLIGGAVIVLTQFDRTIHGFQDLERHGVLLPFLGPVFCMSGQRRFKHARILCEKGSRTEESFRYLRVAINFSSPPQALRNLIFTACLSGEGKSFVSRNLAVSLARDGNRTLLVDACLGRPFLHKVFAVENTLGLSSCLTSTMAMDPVIRETTVENLSLCAAGPSSRNAAELLGSQRMREFLEAAGKRFDRILIDAPSLAEGQGGLSLARLAGHVILVVESGRTPAVLLRKTKDTLDGLGVRILGVILNRVDSQEADIAGRRERRAVSGQEDYERRRSPGRGT